jgi:protein N-terminal amidase
MDLNPFTPGDRKIDTWQYELADYCLASTTDLLVLLNAWLDPGNEADDEPSWTTLGYWAARSRPLWSKCKESLETDKPSYNRYTTFVVCNRTGEENGK